MNRKHSFTGRLPAKIMSVLLVTTLLLSMMIVGTTAFAAETKTEGDYTYTVLSDGTAQITKYSGAEAQVTVPAQLGGADVSSIGTKAFENNDEIESVTFSEGIKTIGDYAFSGCDLLETVNIPSSVTLIDKYAFEKCRALQSVDIPSTVKTVEEGAFYACPILSEVTLHEGTEKLGYRFIGGTVVSSVYVPSTVTKSDRSFAEIDMLDSVSFAEGVTTIPRDMFEKNSSLRTIVIPDTVTTIGTDCFAYMGSLESIVIPDSVTDWGEYVCCGCPKLKSVTIGSGVTYIPGSAFSECNDLTSIKIPENVTVIGNFAFKDCKKLETVTLPTGLTNLGAYSFERTPIKAITIPATVTSGNNSFHSCASLKTINFAEGTTTFVEGLFQGSAVENVVIPEGVTELSAYMFDGCRQLASVTLPSTLRRIRRYAFSDCVALNNVVIPSGVKAIEEYAFRNTAALTSFKLQEGVQTLGRAIFEGSALTTIYIPKTLSATDLPFAGSNISEPVFCEGIANLTDHLFRGDRMLTKIKIPDTVVKLGNSCFRETGLEAVVIPDSVKTIGTSLFEECNSLYAVKLGKGLRRIPQWCFYSCDLLQNVIIPENICDMDANAFEQSGVSYQKLPQSLHYIPVQAFKDCPNLTCVECSDQLESIGDYAFERCYEFTTLKTSVESLEFNNSTFKDCPKFTDKRFYIFNPAGTGVESTGNIGVDHTLVHFTVKYDVRDDWDDGDIQMKTLYLNYPKNLELVTTSLSATGFTFDNEAYTGDYKSFSLSGGKSSGELRFSAYVNSSEDALKDFSAEVELNYRGTYFRKPIGNVRFTTAKLSLFAPSRVTETTVNVSGYTVTPNKNITVRISRVRNDGTKDSTVSYTVAPNKYTGKYISDDLKIVEDGKVAVNGDRFEVYSECGGIKSDTVSFTYAPGAVKITSATETVNIKKFISPGVTNLSHGGQNNTYDITGIFTKGTSPVISINPAEMLQFRFKLENDENIICMVLMSHKGNDYRFMPVLYDEASDTWIGEGYFNIPNHELTPGQTYVPGALNLFYLYGERWDGYRSFYYDENGKSKNTAPVGGLDLFGDPEEEDIFYYDKDGNPHGNLGDYNDTIRDTVKNVFVNIIKGEWADAASDTVVGGLKSLWQWGNTDHNFFRMTHGGVYLGPDGLPVLPGDGGDMYNHDPSKDGKQRNAIDPSGIVYEAVEGNRVEGATATIFKLNEESGEWEEWNAADYEQQNPLLTNSEGAYAWLTDEGRFKVTVSKEGYETVTSEEFDIPPEKLDLNFALVDTTTHPTATVEKDEESGSFMLRFSKFMKPETVTADTVTVDGLSDVTITPVYLSEGDEFADTFEITGKLTKADVKFTVSDQAQSYSGVSAEAFEQTIEGNLILGDVNCDGVIDVNDATYVQMAAAEIIELNELQKKAADVNGDDVVDINDATYIQMFAADIITSFAKA